jgi:hypothetical protein
VYDDEGGFLHSFLVLFIGYETGYQHWTLEMPQHSLRRWKVLFGHSLLDYLDLRCCCYFEALSALVMDSPSLGIYPQFLYALLVFTTPYRTSTFMRDQTVSSHILYD